VGLPRLEKLKRWFVYAPSFPGLPTASSPGQHRRYAGFIKPATPLTRKPPSVLSPFAQRWCYLHWGDVLPSPPRALPLCPRSYGLMCHSPWALSSFSISPRSKSLCRLCPAPAAHGSFPTLSLKIFPWMLDPVPRRSPRVLLPVSSPVSSAFPQRRWGRLPALIRESRLLAGPCFRGCRYFLMFRPPSLLTPQIVPTAAHIATGQPGLLRPGISCFVTSARTGYANRPNTGN
jgi:hypothetical protein